VGIAELLAHNGHRTRLALTDTQPAAHLMDPLTRLYAIGQLDTLGVEVLPNLRLFGVDPDTAYLQHTITSAPRECEDVDTVVLSLVHEPVRELEDDLADLGVETVSIGDCLAPRTAEQAVLEGLRVASDL